jgi:uncharacterized protein (DUF983 family)
MNTLTLTTIKDGALPASKAPYVNSEFKAALHCKCPKCRTGNMFANSPLNIFGQKMNENCSHCGFKFEIEPGELRDECCHNGDLRSGHTYTHRQ